MTDPYQVLGAPRDADKQTIKKAYRKLAAEHHPDRGGDAEKFKQVAEAYSILSDDQKRQQYHARQNRGHGFGMGFDDIFGQGFNPFDDLFTRPRQQARPRIKKNTKLEKRPKEMERRYFANKRKFFNQSKYQLAPKLKSVLFFAFFK